LRVKAADGDPAAIGIAQTSRISTVVVFPAPFARASKDLAFFDAEADTAHGFDVAVPLDEVLHLKDGLAMIVAPNHRRAQLKEV